MSYPTGTFSSPYAGKLVLSLVATWANRTFDRAGFRGSTTTGNIAIRGYAVPAGTAIYTPVYDKFSSVAVLELDYPGGSIGWPVGVVEDGHTNPTSGIYQYSFSNVVLTCRLYKR